jgi:hypothetical protein
VADFASSFAATLNLDQTKPMLHNRYSTSSDFITTGPRSPIMDLAASMSSVNITNRYNDPTAYSEEALPTMDSTPAHHVKPILDMRATGNRSTESLANSDSSSSYVSAFYENEATMEVPPVSDIPKTAFTFTATLERRNTISATPKRPSQTASASEQPSLQRTPSLRSRLPVSLHGTPKLVAASPAASDVDPDTTKRRLKFIGSSLPTLKYFKNDATSKIPVRAPSTEPEPALTGK